MQIVDKASALRIPPFFRLAFRPFFLSASLFSVVAMLLWALFWSGNALLPMYGHPIWWHAHEMLIGFTGAMIVGFLLTAVQNWTGVPGVNGWKLASIFFAWLAARFLLLFASPHFAWMIIDQAWLILALSYLAIPIMVRRQWRNLFFVPLLCMLLFLNIRMHGVTLGWGTVGLRGIALQIVLLIAVLMSVMGGRVIPFFTARGTQTEPITRIPWCEHLALWPMWLVFLAAVVINPELPSSWFGWLCVVSALAQIPRILRWRSLKTVRIPLLWMLHLAFYATILGVLLIGLSQLMPQSVSYSIAVHVLTVGGIGCMVLAMIARVSLGHTGRILQTGKWIQLAFVALVFALCVRTLLIAFFPSLTMQAYVLSALLWALSFGIFAVVFWPILTRARPDGHPG